MRLTCPSCAATYEVPDTLRPARRRIRCSACGMEWVAEPDETQADALMPEPPPPAPEPMRAPPPPEARSSLFQPPRMTAPPPPPPRSAGLVVAWIVSLLVLIGLAAGGYTERATIMRVWPPSARLFTALGVGPK